MVTNNINVYMNICKYIYFEFYNNVTVLLYFDYAHYNRHFVPRVLYLGS